MHKAIKLTDVLVFAVATDSLSTSETFNRKYLFWVQACFMCLPVGTRLKKQ